MKRWEYQVVKFETGGLLGGIVDGEQLEQALNALGAGGWEVTGTSDTAMQHGATRDLVVILKRPLEASLPESSTAEFSAADPGAERFA
ncbi:DUF4177 domain-containing protein [Deinococcus alpinitundrae]|uniref:DUF4177 domain-containing protein n=1 Tax=Deinococcus alpinitundrae TaxID=468913 RepID=UPI00137B3463|nr:DUF4177 domain-containing protein [Deinococcus alpinitundrae]